MSRFAHIQILENAAHQWREQRQRFKRSRQMSELVNLLRVAGHNETFASGELYLAAADRIAELEAQIEMHSALSEHRAEKIDRIYEILGQMKNDGWTGTQYALASRILKVLEQADE